MTIKLCPFAKLLITSAICTAVIIFNVIVSIIKKIIIKNLDLILGSLFSLVLN